MRQLMLVVVAMLCIVPIASAQWENNGASDAPGSLDEMTWVVQEASATAKKLEVLKEKIADVNRRGEAIATRMKAHNDEHPGGCAYPPDNPHFCDGWVQEAADLNSEHRGLLMEFKVLSIDQGMATTHQSVMLARLRLWYFLDQLTTWEKIVVKCANKDFNPSLEDAHRCLVDAWESHP